MRFYKSNDHNLMSKLFCVICFITILLKESSLILSSNYLTTNSMALQIMLLDKGKIKYKYVWVRTKFKYQDFKSNLL